MYDMLEDYLFFKPQAKHREHDTPAGQLIGLEDAFPQEEIDGILEEYPTAAYVYYDYFKEINDTVFFLLDGDCNKLIVDVIDEDDLVVSEYSDVPDLHEGLLEMWKKHVKIPRQGSLTPRRDNLTLQ